MLTYNIFNLLWINLLGGRVFWSHQGTSQVVSEKIKIPLVLIMSRMKDPNRHELLVNGVA
ncbi:hypothetical protein V1477_015168 [Vespula maculifrons]|uniref:Uncharacterized protein n=1 Tax=Vespula maculifrons TaxID=7453 RepID=A0ABD2BJH8_VESMC